MTVSTKKARKAYFLKLVKAARTLWKIRDTFVLDIDGDEYEEEIIKSLKDLTLCSKEDAIEAFKEFSRQKRKRHLDALERAGWKVHRVIY